MSQEALRNAALSAVQAVGEQAKGMTVITLGSLCDVVFCIMQGAPDEHRAVFAVPEALDPRLGDAAWRPATDAEMQTMDDSMTAWAMPPHGPLH